ECVRLQRPTREIELILKPISVVEAGVLGAEPLRFYIVGGVQFFAHMGGTTTPPMCALCIVKFIIVLAKSLLYQGFNIYL
ncbi:hypothetical protein ACUXE9_002547, partial [Staphylococcus epidermidis]